MRRRWPGETRDPAPGGLVAPDPDGLDQDAVDPFDLAGDEEGDDERPPRPELWAWAQLAMAGLAVAALVAAGLAAAFVLTWVFR